MILGEYIESDFGNMIINPKYKNDNDGLKNAQAKLRRYEELEEFNKIQIDEIKELKQKYLMF